MHNALELDFLVERQTFHISGFMFKVQKGLIQSQAIIQLFEPIVNIHSVNTREAERKDLIVPVTRTLFGARSVLTFGSKIWILLPISLRECNTIESFTHNYWKVYDRLTRVHHS